jgi:hypothetical protein
MPVATDARSANSSRSAIALLVLIAGALLATSARAEHYAPASLYEPASCEEIKRSGNPWDCSRWAKPQAVCDYVGYYVGGGAPRRCGRTRCPDEGTWGWDYHGRWFPRRVRLAWFCWPHPQGGEGHYQPDGPRVLETMLESPQKCSR